ncbi:MAG: FHA domain-containing protein [Bdellovibrionales bacterium]|nr:FHA domain-containing protein [Bdellovibrionales bacterium]
MAKVIVKLHGKETRTVDLVDGVEYIAGRSQDCQIPLENQKGISRHHFKIAQEGGAWTARLNSRYGSLIYDGEAAEAIQLIDGCAFQVPPYEFVYVETPEMEATARQLLAAESPADQPSPGLTSPATSASAQAAPVPHGYAPGTSAPKPNSGKTGLVPFQGVPGFPPNSPSGPPEGNLEATSPGTTNLIPHLRIKYPGRDHDDVLELEGHIWVIGRDETCEIPIDDGHVSRRHFELTQTNEGLYLTDLGSANGTEVNGHPVTPHEPYKLNSGDRISIMDLLIFLELRDVNFKNTLMAVRDFPVPVAPPPEAFAAPVIVNPNVFFDSQGPGAVKLPAVGVGYDQFIPKAKRSNRVRLMLLVLVPLLLIGLFMPKKSKDTGQTDSSSQQGGQSFDTLSPDQKAAVRDIYNLADNHYRFHRYQLCLSELGRLHSIIPFYETSKTLQQECQRGTELEAETQELARKERMRLEAQQRVQMIVTQCRDKLGTMSSIDAAKECLGPAIELDPTDPGIVEIISAIEAREQQERQDQMNKNATQNRIRAGDNQYQKAKGLYKKGRLRDSIAEYERYLNGGFPDPKNLASTAQRELASVRKELNVKVTDKLANCRMHYEKKNYKPAIEACDAALSEDPDHSEAKSVRSLVLSDLRREMKTIYEDSVLEESLGEIEGAKEKWKKIIQSDLESDDYYLKAKRKLQKYGVGI